MRSEGRWRNAVLFDAPRFVDQPLEDPPHRVGIEWMLRSTAQAIEHFSFPLGIVHGNVVSTLVLPHCKHHTHTFGDQFEDAAIQVVDASPQRFELRSRLHGQDRNTR